VKISRTAVITIMLLLTYRAHGAPARRDFLVIGNPQACALYDQYEQQLPEAKKRLIPPDAPFEIVNERQVMGDQITQAMRLSLLSVPYHVMLDDGGKPAGLPASASVKRYRGCTPLYDTLIVAASAIQVTQNPAGGGRRSTLKKDDVVVRIFTWHGTTFLYRTGSRPVFGWTTAAKNSLRPLKKQRTGKNDDFALLHLRIMRRLNEANELYDTLFSYFNRTTHQEKSAPKWVAQTSKDYRYVLQGSAEVTAQLEKSNLLIFRDIEQILLGKPYLVTYRHGAMTIGPR
jgi:hypothetical protein